MGSGYSIFLLKVFDCHLTATCYNFLKNAIIFNKKHKIYEFSLFLMVFYLVSKES